MERASRIMNHLQMNPVVGFQYPANKFEAELRETAQKIATAGILCNVKS